MLCPRDQTELRLAERRRVAIDYCPRCRGIWLDRGELDKILEREAADLWADRVQWAHATLDRAQAIVQGLADQIQDNTPGESVLAVGSEQTRVASGTLSDVLRCGARST